VTGGDQYAESQLQNLLAEDSRVAEQGIQVVRLEQGLALVGEVESEQRRETILRLAQEAFPDLRIHCDIGVTRMHEPDEVEQL
jgi:hypothetical protein